MLKINHPLPKQTKSSAVIKSYKIAGDVFNDMRNVRFHYISCALYLMLLGLYCIVSFVFTFDCLLSIDDITRILLIQLLPLIIK